VLSPSLQCPWHWLDSSVSRKSQRTFEHTEWIDFVTIITTNYPNGIRIAIAFEGLPLPRFQTPSRTQPRALSIRSSPLQKQCPFHSRCFLTTKPLTCSSRNLSRFLQKAIVPKFGAVSITFQDDFLTLQNASIDDTNIVWTLDSLKLGSMQIRVTSKLEKLMHTQFYDVRVFLPQVEKGATAASNGAVTSIGNHSTSLAVGHLQRERGVTIRRPYCRGDGCGSVSKRRVESLSHRECRWANSAIHRECGETDTKLKFAFDACLTTLDGAGNP
jgi:hypothetical protein